MNEPALRLEEQIISLFSNFKTEIYQGWVLKETSCHTIIYPLYGSSDNSIVERIRACEEISRQKSLSCEFRIIEHTNYHLAACLEDNGYKLRHCYIVGEWHLNEAGFQTVPNQSEVYKKRKVTLRKTTGTNITENIVANDGSVVGIKRQGILYLPNGKLPHDMEISDIFLFATENQISDILVNIPEDEKLLTYYKEAGFHKAYLYRCYQKEDL